MSYFCFLNRGSRRPSHFEVLPDDELDHALTRAERMMRERPDCESAEVWDDEHLVRRISPGRAPGRPNSGACHPGR